MLGLLRLAKLLLLLMLIRHMRLLIQIRPFIKLFQVVLNLLE